MVNPEQQRLVDQYEMLRSSVQQTSRRECIRQLDPSLFVEHFSYLEERDADVVKRLNAVYNKALEFIPEGSRHFDVASWNGSFVVDHLLKKASHVVGIDFEEWHNLLAEYYAHSNQVEDRVQFLQMTAQDIKKNATLLGGMESFDSATAVGFFNEGYEGSPGDEILILESIYSMLKPGGTFISTIADTDLRCFYPNAARFYNSGYEFPPDEYGYMLQQIYGEKNVLTYGQIFLSDGNIGTTFPMKIQRVPLENGGCRYVPRPIDLTYELEPMETPGRQSGKLPPDRYFPMFRMYVAQKPLR
ncbi:MAG: class I SAM-dependent methyltransferase [Patescibacteria group bacterium]